MSHCRIISVVALFCGLWVVTGCSLLVELDECQTQDDCSEEGWICTEDNLCQPSEATELIAEPCTRLVGDVEDEDAFVIGVLLPLSGAEAGFGQPLFDGIRLAKRDFNSLNGIQGRSIVLLACDTEGRNSLALAGAQHLADVGVDAVIGPDYSDQTIEVANDVTIDAEMVLVSPSATAAAISGLHDNGLVWRTTASDTIQGQALGQLVNYALDERPHYDDLAPEHIPEDSSIAVLRRRNDPYAQGLREAVTDQLDPDLLADGDRFSVYAYANEADGDAPDYADIAADIISDAGDDRLGPDVIVVVGSSEAWRIADQLEGEFNNPPLFVFADAARNSQRAQEASDSLRGRVWGTAPQNVGDRNYAPYTSFRLRYQEDFGEDPSDFQFVANAFDALYVIALGASYGGFTGPGIAEGMAQLSDGETVHPSASQAQSAMSTLAGGSSIDFDGASGPLNFDDNGDPQASPIILWCFDDAGLPGRGVILDDDLVFTPQNCAGADDNDTNDQSGTCTDDEDCGTGFCCVDGDCVDPEDDDEIDETCEPVEDGANSGDGVNSGDGGDEELDNQIED